MNKEIFFTGRTEKYIISLLKERKKISTVEIDGCYSSKNQADAFINKILAFDLAELIIDGEAEFLNWKGETTK